MEHEFAQALEQAAQRLDTVKQREQTIHSLLEQRREDLARKSAHIDHLQQLLDSSQRRELATRQDFDAWQQHVRRLARELLTPPAPSDSGVRAADSESSRPSDDQQNAA